MVSISLIMPYAAWMILMITLPPTAWAYAIRTALVMAMLLAIGWRYRKEVVGILKCGGIGAASWGLVAGVAVFLIWILPEQFGWSWYSRLFIVGDTPAQPIAGSLLWIRLLGSACVITVAEELFFRKWLIGFAGFWWSVSLFAVEHDRWLVGAIAGAIYAFVYLRKGLVTAIAAHVTTNLALGIWVIASNQWQFW